MVVNGFWSILQNVPGIRFQGRFPERFGRLEADVACRSLGFAAGAHLMVGDSSPFPLTVNNSPHLQRITCSGSESSLADCDMEVEFSIIDNGIVADEAVALICTTPSGAQVAYEPLLL